LLLFILYRHLKRLIYYLLDYLPILLRPDCEQDHKIWHD